MIVTVGFDFPDTATGVALRSCRVSSSRTPAGAPLYRRRLREAKRAACMTLPHHKATDRWSLRGLASRTVRAGCSH